MSNKNFETNEDGVVLTSASGGLCVDKINLWDNPIVFDESQEPLLVENKKRFVIFPIEHSDL